MPTTTEQIPMAKLGETGDSCAVCATPLDVDQRYCLECGARRGDARLPFEQYLPGTPAPAADAGGDGNAAAPPATARQNEPSPVGAVIGVALLGTMLLLGVLLGRGSDDPAQAPAPVVQVGDGTAATSAGAGAGSSETVSNTKVTSEWPEGKDGWTVELGSLPKEGTTAADVDATKQKLTDQGAGDLGVLDSDLYASLPAGTYVVYSGVYDSKADADAALKDLGGGFADAQVVEVSADKASAGGGGSSGGGALLSGGSGGGSGGGGGPGDTVEASSEDLQALENTTGDAYQEQLNNIPDTVATPGEAPPDDPSVEPGGGTGGGQVIR
ncbi:MAG TPA: SPOR domain-containing protein [Solirubrobacterales bacterium]|jgi:uncharacterized membrane protein YgcG